MPPRRTSLQVDVSRDLYIVCAFMYQGMPHQQAQAFTVAHNPQKALADSGAASLCLNHGRLLSALSPPRRKDFWRLHLELGIKRKRREEKNGRGIFRSLVSLSLPEFDCSRRWFIAPLFWLHMLRARPILGVCFLSQPFQCPSFGCA